MKPHFICPAVMLALLLTGSRLRAADPAQLNLDAVTKPYYQFEPLKPGMATGIEPGHGVNMSNPSAPQFLPYSAFKNDAIKKTGLGIECVTIKQVTTIQMARSLDSFYFDLKVGPWVNLEISDERLKRHMEQSTLVYIVIHVSKGDGLVLSKRPVWGESPEDSHDLTGFLGSWGSHFVRRVYLGRTIVVRAEMQSKLDEDVKKFKAALQASVAFFSLKGGISKEHAEYLSSASVSIQATVIAGKVIPSSSLLLPSMASVTEFCNKVQSGDVIVHDGPIGVELASYASTLVHQPMLRKLLEPRYELLSNDEIQNRKLKQAIEGDWRENNSSRITVIRIVEDLGDKFLCEVSSSDASTWKAHYFKKSKVFCWLEGCYTPINPKRLMTAQHVRPDLILMESKGYWLQRPSESPLSEKDVAALATLIWR